MKNVFLKCTTLQAWPAQFEDIAMVDTPALLSQCAPQVAPFLMRALVHVESSWRPLAIGMDAGQGTVSQPVTLSEAVASAKALSSAGRQFSVGLAQIHASNVKHYGLSWEQVFDPCTNLKLGQEILSDFYRAANRAGYEGPAALRAALRGYNSGGLHRVASDAYAARVFTYAQRAFGVAPTDPGAQAHDGAWGAIAPFTFALRARVGPQVAREAAASMPEEAPELFQKHLAIRGF